MRGYLAIKNFTEWFNKDEVLFDKLKDSGVGLYNNRTKFISEFATKYWQNPNLFKFKKIRSGQNSEIVLSKTFLD